MSSPEVSVVMGVYNGAADLPRTLDSVLGQQGVDLEFIVVDDGSNDEVPEILECRAREDRRLRVVHQTNGGLTQALVYGCSLARGEFIARQDAGGDVSLPGRLANQISLLRAQPDAALATCATRFVAPDGEFLFDAVIKEEQLNTGLHTLSMPGVTGPSHHGACLFRRVAYEQVGGYRAQFTLAQDLDLWLRMIEVGRFIAISDVMYKAVWSLGGLTNRLKPEQDYYAKLALDAALHRRTGLAEPELPEPRRSTAMRGATARHVQLSQFHYFAGSCIAKRDRSLARTHFWRSFKANPLNLAAMVRLLLPDP